MRRVLTSRVRVATRATLVCAAFAAVAALPASASANAVGCTTAGSGLPWYGLNSAYTCIDVSGHGDRVREVGTSWAGVGTLCNYRFVLWYSDLNGHVYRVQRSPRHIGCRYGAGGFTWTYGNWRPKLKIYSGWRARTGEVCVQVSENGRRVGGAACESLFP